ncbi:thiamine-binding protein [Kitasatospora sp. CB01950]|uniref:thiamine-binding protein n=1 Tax=Kitasatospora sp. CB01950 TaxID=1703930 RepID=UPI000A9EC460|nr:thiamine-binding protein [Kitasatospora sp. CB01950]
MVEFTTEPFDLNGFPEHARTARRAAEEAGLAVSVGPFGTSAEGDAEQALAAVTRLLRETLAVGASRISLQVSVLTDPPEQPLVPTAAPTAAPTTAPTVALDEPDSREAP